MLPTKIRTKLIGEFGERFYQFPPKSIFNHLIKYDDEENLAIAMTFRDKVTKINFKHPDGNVENTFTSNTNRRSIINSIRSNDKRNYHDYLTVFNFDTDHPIYDLIVEVIYRYVYS